MAASRPVPMGSPPMYSEGGAEYQSFVEDMTLSLLQEIDGRVGKTQKSPMRG
jgi:hypothetical protein